MLTGLQASLQAELRLALVGPGGAGKSALVVEYANRRSGDYDVVWWVRAGRPETLAADYAALGVALGLSEETAHDQGLQIEMVRRWLEGHGRWLLVLDDAAALETWSPFLATGAGGHVVVTTPTPVSTSDARTVSVPGLGREEAMTLLLQRTGEDDTASARDLADALACLPLPLEHAAAYVTADGTLADYLTRVRRDTKKVVSVGQPPDYRNAVATTWRLSFDAVRRSSRAAADLLRLLAFFASDDIPLELLLAHPGALPTRLRRNVANDTLDEVVGVLSTYSLVERHADALSVHRLVQAAVRDDLSSSDERLWAGAAVRFMASTYPTAGDEPGAWLACQRLMPHALVVAEHAERLSIEARATSHLLGGVAVYLRSRGRFEPARAALERALAIDEVAYGRGHPAVGSDLNNLGLVLRDLGDLSSAKERLGRALAIDEAAHGPQHPVVATRLNNLALVLRDLGDLDGGRKRLERALAIDEAAYGADHVVVGTDLHNLGLVLRDSGDPMGASSRFRRALAIAEDAYPPDHPVVGTRLNSLALALQDLGDLAGAKEGLARAAAITETVYGPHDPRLSTQLNNLALVLQDLGDPAGARDRFERALVIDEEVYGSGHPEVGTDLNNLALVLQDLGDLPGALACLERALAIDEAAYGADDPEVATDLSNLALVLQDMGDAAGAKQRLERAVAITEAAYGPDHPKVATLVGNLNTVLPSLQREDD